ncbi:MAG: hypothetical protein KGL39_14250 [Patescibacteria group bacterium]|nr:hypothetical protein [Patescibacteria group bacterium]
MNWPTYLLISVAVIALGGWWNARKEAQGWKRAFISLWNSRGWLRDMD